MGLGGPSFASRDSGLTPDGSTIETKKGKPLHEDAGASGETKKSIEGVFWISILIIAQFREFVKGGDVVWIAVLKVVLCLMQAAFDLAVALYLMVKKED